MSLSIFMSMVSTLSLLLSLIASIAFIIHKNITNHLHKAKKKLPPGELGFPWIGETLDFYRAQKKNRLFEDFVQPRIAKHGKTFKTKLMGSPTVVVNGPDANRFFLSNEFKLVVSSWPSSSVQLMGKDSIMEKQGDAHRAIRGVIASSLCSAGLEAIVPRICDSVGSHLERNWYSQDTVNLYWDTKTLTFGVVFECLLGMDVEVGLVEKFERVLEGVFALPLKYFPGSKFWRARRTRAEIERILVGVVREKRREMERGGGGERECASSGLLSQLVEEMIKGEISEEEVVDNVVLLVFAAHDTTSFAIAMIFRMLAHHPECYSLLLQEHEEIMKSKSPGETLTLEDTKKMKYTWQVAREAMRLFPPIFGSFRKAITDIEFEGFTIPKGWKVLWTAYGTHYDEEYFPEATRFEPRRFEEPVKPYAFVPFGGGPRLCAGYQLAKLNILVFVHYVVTRYEWSLVYPHESITVDPLPFPSLGMPIKISPKLL